MMGMDDTIIDRIAFGGVGERHEETTCQQALISVRFNNAIN
jgi:hypothetical protein